MGTGQSCKGKSNNEFRVSILAGAVMKLMESKRITREDIKKYIAELQADAIKKRSGSNDVLCDILDDPEVLRLVTSLIYHQFLLDSLPDVLRNADDELEREEAHLHDYIHYQYLLDGESSFHIDYERLCIMNGISYEGQQINKEILEKVKQILSYDKKQISKLYANIEELDPLAQDLIGLLASSESEAVRSTCQRLFHMNREELKAALKEEKRDPVHYIALMFYELKR
jgi:hypothetical protein